jgi:hypothetical protein
MAAGKMQKKRRPSKAEILALKKKLQAITKPFFKKYGKDPVGGGKARKSAKSASARVAMMALGGSADGEGEGGIDFLLIGPPGPRPPPKLEIDILNLSEY